MKKILVIITVVLVTIIFVTCKRTIKRRLDWHMIGKDSTTLSLEEIFPFQWDTMYIFERLGDRKLWHQYKNHDLLEPDFTRFIVLIKDDDEVFREEEVRVSEPHDVSITVEYGSQHHSDTLTPSARFRVVKKRKYGYSMYLIKE